MISGKHAELANIIESTQADIVIGTESWLTPSIKSPEVLPSDFNCYRKDSSTGEGGGVFILVSKKYESEEPEELKVDNNCDFAWTKIKVGGSKDIYVGSFYRLPNNIDAEYIGTLESYLARIPIHNGAHLWLCGDFNLPDIDWTNENIKTKSSHSL
jgi:hypothetical protein